MRNTPRTRSGNKSLREEFNKSVEGLITLIGHEELKGKLFTTKISLETPIEPQRESSTSKAQEWEIAQDINYAELGTRQETKIIKGSQENACLLLKTQSISFLPVLQGTNETALFIISNTFKGGMELENT
ncbi:unnamed protein product [Arabis nemorensis]|uniref:Uncharacterized protein n=1 Tax=Arabis nemorensis TaxID=586526 RepID=A0A565BK14_9BRAS|nr:unnamed protein product [Arabis nemorensis]